MDPKRENDLANETAKERSKTNKVRKTVVFLSQHDSESALGLSEVPDGDKDNMRMSNFMKDLQAARADDTGAAQQQPQMMNLGIRGFTKVKELLEGFENDSDFVISQRDANQSVLGSARDRTGTMMTNKTLNAQQRAEFEGLIEQSRAFIEELKFMENEREIADG